MLNKKLVHEKIQYDIPSSISCRSAGIGYGNRSDFTKGKGVGVPPPNSYELHTDFSKEGGYTPQWSFGISRDAVKVLVPGHFPPDKTVPGPGTYYKNIQFGKDAKKYSLRPRTVNIQEATNTALKSPGPGAYKPKIEIDSMGRYFNSKYKSSRAAIWNPPRSSRFAEQSKWVKDLPGPGHYKPKVELNEKGNYFLSNFKNSLVRTFGSDIKKSIMTDTKETPGPGSYRSFSDFGTTEFPSVYNLRAKTSEERMKRNRTAKSVLSEPKIQKDQL